MKRGDAVVVLDRAAPAPAADVERALGEAEVLLEVDQQEVDAQPVLGRGPEAVLVAPCDRALEHGLLVRPVVPAPCVVRIVEVRDGELPCNRVPLRHFRSAFQSGSLWRKYSQRYRARNGPHGHGRRQRRRGVVSWTRAAPAARRRARRPRPRAAPHRRCTPPDGRDRSGISPHTIRHFPDRRRARLPPSFRPRTPTPGKEEHDAGCVRTRPAPARHAGDRRRLRPAVRARLARPLLRRLPTPRRGPTLGPPMNVDLYEKIWIGISIGLIAVFVGSIGYGASAFAGHPAQPRRDDRSEDGADRRAVRAAGRHGPAGRAASRSCCSRRCSPSCRTRSACPREARDLPDDQSRRRARLRDRRDQWQRHGGPRLRVQFTTVFDEPGEYLIVCNEYCGLGHHFMQGKLIVTREGT